MRFLTLPSVLALIASIGGIPAMAQTVTSPPPTVTSPECPTFAPDPTVGADPSPSPAPSSGPDGSNRLPLWRGSWDTSGRQLAIAPRAGATVVSDPRHPFGTIVWGGVGVDGRLLGDGVMIDAATGESRLLPPAPICPRRAFASSLDIDGNVTIWGGIDQAGEPLADGASYSFENGAWRYLAPWKLPGGPAVMAGGVIVVADPETGLPVAGLLHSGEYVHRWEGPFEVPLPRGERYAIAACCPADENESVTVYSVQSGGYADAVISRNLYSPGRDWVPFGRVPFPVTDGVQPTYGHALERDQLVWITTTDAVIEEDEIPAPMGIVFHAEETGPPWGLIEPPPDGVAGDPSLVLSPTHLISVHGMAAYDLRRERWLRLPPRDERARFGTPVGATAWWQDGKLWVFGGVAPDGSMESWLWTFTPRLPRGTRDLPTRTVGTNGGCQVTEDGTWRLTGDVRDPMIVWARSGNERRPLWWPDGWVARFRPRLVILDTLGKVRARDGEVCETVSGSGG